MSFCVRGSPCVYHKITSAMESVTACSETTNSSVTIVNNNIGVFENIRMFFYLDPCEIDGTYRLSGGQTALEGLVELCYEGQYRSLCLNGVSQPDLVCGALGYFGGKHTNPM